MCVPMEGRRGPQESSTLSILWRQSLPELRASIFLARLESSNLSASTHPSETGVMRVCQMPGLPCGC